MIPALAAVTSLAILAGATSVQLMAGAGALAMGAALDIIATRNETRTASS